LFFRFWFFQTFFVFDSPLFYSLLPGPRRGSPLFPLCPVLFCRLFFAPPFKFTPPRPYFRTKQDSGSADHFSSCLGNLAGLWFLPIEGYFSTFTLLPSPPLNPPFRCVPWHSTSPLVNFFEHPSQRISGPRASLFFP